MAEDNASVELDRVDTDTIEEQETVRKIYSLFNRSKRASAKFRNKLKPNWEFVVDQAQWPHRLPKYRHQEVLNFTFSIIQSIIPVMTDNRPMVDVLPTEPEDRDFAAMLSGVIEDIWERINLDMRMVEVIFDALTLGTGITYVGWDKEMERGMGNIDVQVVDPIYCYPDPHAVDVNGKGSKFFIYTEPVFIGELKRRYPDKADRIGWSKTKPENTSKVETAYMEWDTGWNPEDQKDEEDGQDDTLLIRAWVKSDETFEEESLIGNEKKYIKKKKYPKGRYVEICNGVLLKDEENEFTDGLFPFAKLVDHAIPRQFWGIGEVEMLKSPQRIINKIHSWILDALNLTGKPVWIVDTSSQVDPDLITNEPGLVIPKTPGSEVRREPGIDIPPSMFNMFQMTKAAFDTINGLGELSQGQKPSGVTSGVAIESLQEAAQNRIRQKNRNFEYFLGDFGKLIISRIMQFYNVPRMIRILNSPSGIPEFFEFSVSGNQAMIKQIETDEASGETQYKDLKTANIKGFPDIRIAVGSALPYAKQQKAQMSLQLFDRQIIDAEEVLSSIQWPNKEVVIERQKQKMEQMAEAMPESAETPNQ